MRKIKTELSKGILKGKVLIVGVGNRFRGDDAAGLELIEELASKPSSGLSLMDAGEVPENYLGRILETRADTILFVDAADLGLTPGSVKLVDFESLLQGSFSTHGSSLKLVADYLKKETEAQIFLLGIQPESLKMGEAVSEPVRKAIEKTVERIIRCMS